MNDPSGAFSKGGICQMALKVQNRIASQSSMFFFLLGRRYYQRSLPEVFA